MQKRRLGKTGLDLTVLSFGASSLGAEFRSIDINEAMHLQFPKILNRVAWIRTTILRDQSPALCHLSYDSTFPIQTTLCQYASRIARAPTNTSPRT